MSCFNQNTDNFMNTLRHDWILSGNKYVLTERYRTGSYMSIVYTNCLFIIPSSFTVTFSMYVGLVTAL